MKWCAVLDIYDTGGRCAYVANTSCDYILLSFSTGLYTFACRRGFNSFQLSTDRIVCSHAPPYANYALTTSRSCP
jgi:hypothetical protein